MKNYEEEHAIALSKIVEVEQIIGYSFHDISILYRAFTRSGYLNEHKKYKSNDYQGLEYLGDAIIGSVVAKTLFDRYNAFSDSDKQHIAQLYHTEEGYLTIVRSFFVGEEMLAYRMEKLGIADRLLLGKGETVNQKIRCDLFEAIIGAVMSDSDDFNVTRDVAYKMLDIETCFDKGSFFDCSIQVQLHVLYTLNKLIFKRMPIDGSTYYIVYDKSKDMKEILRKIDTPNVENIVYHELCNKGYGQRLNDNII